MSVSGLRFVSCRPGVLSEGVTTDEGQEERNRSGSGIIGPYPGPYPGGTQTFEGPRETSVLGSPEVTPPQ